VVFMTHGIVVHKDGSRLPPEPSGYRFGGTGEQTGPPVEDCRTMVATPFDAIQCIEYGARAALVLRKKD